MLRFAISDGRGGVPGRTVRWAAGLAVDLVLVREKELAAGALVELCRGVQAAARVGTRVLVSGRVDVALAAGLHGVHLSAGAGELTVGEVRRLMPTAYVSVSCHKPEEVRRACEAGVNAVLFAPVFGKWVDGVQVGAGVGIGSLREACEAASGVPVFALGGVTQGNAAECMRAGAAGVAGIRLFAGLQVGGGTGLHETRVGSDTGWMRE